MRVVLLNHFLIQVCETADAPDSPSRVIRDQCSQSKSSVIKSSVTHQKKQPVSKVRRPARTEITPISTNTWFLPSRLSTWSRHLGTTRHLRSTHSTKHQDSGTKKAALSPAHSPTDRKAVGAAPQLKVSEETHIHQLISPLSTYHLDCLPRLHLHREHLLAPAQHLPHPAPDSPRATSTNVTGGTTTTPPERARPL